jgi:glycosyltransferase involved in cell wall biosynthesis
VKKVILLSPAYPLRGGLAAFGECLAKAMLSAGYNVTIYTFSLQYPNFLFPGKTQYSTDTPPDDLSIEVNINSISPINWWKIGQKLKRLAPDLIICVFWLPFMAACLGTILRIAKTNKHSQIVALIHNMIPHEKRFGDKWLVSYFAKAPHAFVTLSTAVANDVKYFQPDKPILIAPHPIYKQYGNLVDKNLALRSLNLTVGKKYILFFGFIRAYKGLDLLLYAMSDERIKQQHDIHLIVAGEYYEEEATYQQLIHKLGIEHQLILHTTYIPNDQVNLYFSAADLVVQPYRTATQSGISQIAYHFEKPMIVTNVGGLPEIVADGESGYIVEPNATSIADAIIDFYTNDKSEILTEGVRQRKHLFTWEHLVEVIKSVTKSC